MIINYNPVAGIFHDKDDAHFLKAMATAKATIGEDGWKQGNSLKTKGGATEVALAELAKEGYKQPTLAGKLGRVFYAETRDTSGNTYRKLRAAVSGETPEKDFLLSLDIDTEVAQCLIQKLDKCTPGQEIVISAFAVPVERNGRHFVNHKGSIKSDGLEVKAEGFWAKANEAAKAAEEGLLKLNITDKKVINQAKDSKKVEAHVDLLKEIEARFKLAFENPHNIIPAGETGQPAEETPAETPAP